MLLSFIRELIDSFMRWVLPLIDYVSALDANLIHEFAIRVFESVAVVCLLDFGVVF